VERLYNEYITNIVNAMVYSGEGVHGVYEGERNAAGQMEGRGTYRYANGNVYEGEYKADQKEGRGTFRFASGNVYEGEWKAGQKEGRGTYWYADGRMEVGFYAADKDVGEGVRWSADGQQAWRLRDGEAVEAIPLGEAQQVCERLALPIPRR